MSDPIQDPFPVQVTSMVDFDEFGVKLKNDDPMSMVSHKMVQEVLKVCHNDTHESTEFHGQHLDTTASSLEAGSSSDADNKSMDEDPHSYSDNETDWSSMAATDYNVQHLDEGPGIIANSLPPVDLTRRRGIGELKKSELNSEVDDAVNQDILQATVRVVADLHQHSIKQENGVEIPVVSQEITHQDVNARLITSVPRGSVNQEPAPEVKPVIQPVDVHDEPSASLFTWITPTPVDSRGQGSHAVEAQVSYFIDSSFASTSQNGRVRRQCDQCCCPIM